MTNTINLTRRGFSTGMVLGVFAAQPALAGFDGAQSMVASATLRDIRENLSVPAISAAVLRNGVLVWSEAQGLADIELNTPARQEHLFRLGSVSKVVTAAIGARLFQAGVVDLDAPIAQYRPDLPVHHRKTTLRQLYSHQGGVRHYADGDSNFGALGGPIDNRIYRTTDDALAIFINDPLTAPPGTAVSYSSFGYTLISAVLESASGKSFRKLIADQVVAPLSLTELALDAPLEIIAGRVRPYDPVGRSARGNQVPDALIVNAAPVNPAYKWAGGGMVASARNLARFGAAHLHIDYLDKQTRDMVFTPITARTPRMPPLGLGWRIDSVPALGHRFHHAGNIQGGRAQVALYPDHDIAVALMTNLGGIPQDIASYADKIAAAYKR